MEETAAIPGYRIIKKIGQGGMASVYLAEQESFGREVALKIINASQSQDLTWGERFRQEAKIIAQLTHQNITPVFDVGYKNGHFYLAMEYMKGGSFSQKVEQGLSPLDVTHIISGLAKGLSFAAEKGFVHRDIKPDNILFREDGSPVILDFGIAKSIQEDTELTVEGAIVGTPRYMSPEQAKGDAIDPRSDIYSLGIVFYELLTGAPPFKADSMISILVKHVNDKPDPLPKALRAFQPVINKMLAKKPQDRYQSAADIAPALQVIVSRKGFNNNLLLQGPAAGDLISGQESNKTVVLNHSHITDPSITGIHLKNNKLLPIAASILLLGGLSIAGYFTYYQPQQTALAAQASRQHSIQKTLDQAEYLLGSDTQKSLSLIRKILSDDEKHARANQLLQNVTKNHLKQAKALLAKEDIAALETLLIHIDALALSDSEFMRVELQLSRLKNQQAIAQLQSQGKQNMAKGMLADIEKEIHAKRYKEAKQSLAFLQNHQLIDNKTLKTLTNRIDKLQATEQPLVNKQRIAKKTIKTSPTAQLWKNIRSLQKKPLTLQFNGELIKQYQAVLKIEKHNKKAATSLHSSQQYALTQFDQAITSNQHSQAKIALQQLQNTHYPSAEIQRKKAQLLQNIQLQQDIEQSLVAANQALDQANHSSIFATKSEHLNQAWQYANKTLTLDTTNQEASNVQQSVSHIHAQQLQSLIDNKDYKDAKSLVKNLQNHNIHSAELEQLTQELNKKSSRKNRVFSGGF
ncbi:MAG: protein kinase [Pseudomonadales bacterium]|nr:protein kinase [Pseudomonadales bacterium]